MRSQIALLVTILACSIAWGQAQAPSNTDQSAPAADMNGMSHDDMKGMPMGQDTETDKSEAAHVMHSMEGHMDMGPHMKMTALRDPKPGDAVRAHRVEEEARRVADKYLDYHTALADGFKIFLPNVPQKIYHFTNGRYAMEATRHFNPQHPTSLLYEKQGDRYKLVGVMYTAPKRFTEEQLDDRVPLSVAQWHEHVNLCIPPAERKNDVLSPRAQFGLRGSIATQEACDVAGGTFRPVIFSWMVHVYPFEKDEAAIWSVDRQHADTDVR
jgi:hypothetical protein